MSIFDYKDAIACYDTIIYYLEGMGLVDPLKLAEYYVKAAAALEDNGQYEKALEKLQKTLHIQEERLNLRHPDLAFSYNNAGLTYGSLGQYEKALEFLHKASVIVKTTMGPEHPELARSYGRSCDLSPVLG